MYNYFVYVVDSQSPMDLCNGRSIATGLRDALTSIRIPCEYFLALNKEMFTYALGQALEELVLRKKLQGGVNPYPIIHLSMHGNKTGIGLTSGEYVSWSELQKLLEPFKKLLGEAPVLCMGSCEGMHAADWGGLSANSYKCIIGNAEKVLQSDLTTGYLAFYNGVFYHTTDAEKLISVMRQASFDQNFYYQKGAGTNVVQFKSAMATDRQ
ncbi:hypothetical protein [Halodesulfovibrio aestuarii]|uniref:Uncharacterized protein n=1 Tax=Halodesulfovibrio aestuarii TaxID=126333 RepID=A0A8G2CB16_9BACT|nr:hypothetical protein [Halodesulfovibrio aestuarii]SHJ45904.1 hypothetical protein SAMN05660830_02473 [Halodesulfovibrio aestuarii]